LSFNLARALRRIKPQRQTGYIWRRPFTDLPVVLSPVSTGAELLLDTCVYIDILQGRAPDSVKDLLKVRISNHSTVCLAELTHLFGQLDPAHAGTRGILEGIRFAIQDIPAHRLSSPSVAAFGEAGMLAGLATRLSGAGPDGLPALLNDASLYLQALEHGWIVLTRNLRDFDVFDQLLPAERVLFYDRV
jgi:predicted nucleic acid-binding protein